MTITPRQETSIQQLVRDTIEEWLDRDPHDPFVTANNAVDFAVHRVTSEVIRILEVE